jgi:hypothetical protein
MWLNYYRLIMSYTLLLLISASLIMFKVFLILFFVLLLFFFFLVLIDHSYEIPLHCSLKSIFVLIWIYYCWSFSYVNNSLKFVFKILFKSVLLHIINDSETNFLPFCVYNCQQRIVNNVWFWETKRVIIDANMQNSIDCITYWKGSALKMKQKVVVMKHNLIEFKLLLLYETIQSRAFQIIADKVRFIFRFLAIVQILCYVYVLFSLLLIIIFVA